MPLPMTKHRRLRPAALARGGRMSRITTTKRWSVKQYATAMANGPQLLEELTDAWDSYNAKRITCSELGERVNAAIAKAREDA